MAMHPHETAILDMADAGLPEEAIIGRGYSPGMVRTTIRIFGSAAGDERAERLRVQRMRDGSRRLAQAIQGAKASASVERC